MLEVPFDTIPCFAHVMTWHRKGYTPIARPVVNEIASRRLRRDTWWRHQMETFSALLALCAGNSPVPVNSPHKGQWRGALMFFDLRPNKRFSKRPWGWWFETPSWSLWRQCNELHSNLTPFLWNISMKCTLFNVWTRHIVWNFKRNRWNSTK